MVRINIDKHSIQHKTHDDRKSKSYTASSTLAVLLIADAPVNSWAPRADRFDLATLCDKLKGHAQALYPAGRIVQGANGKRSKLTGVVDIDCFGFADHEHNKSDPRQSTWLWIRVDMAADKPSALPTQEQAMAALWTQKDTTEWCERIEAAVAEVWAEKAERKRLAAEMQNAEKILGCLIQEVRKQARSVVRYEQRLAALKAEYAAELDVQASLLSAKMRAEGDTWESGERIDQRLLEVAVAALPGHLSEGQVFPGESVQHAFSYSDEDGYTRSSRVDPEALKLQ